VAGTGHPNTAIGHDHRLTAGRRTDEMLQYIGTPAEQLPFLSAEKVYYERKSIIQKKRDHVSLGSWALS
jgi:hypothetical protein